MARRPAPIVQLDQDQRAALTAWARSRVRPQRQVLRARIVLLASEGVVSSQIAEELHCSEPSVRLWRRRFGAAGVAGIERDAPGRGRPRTHDDAVVAKVLTVTRGRPPKGETYWSSRAVAAEVGVSASTVQRIWRKFDLQPRRTRGSEFRADPAPAEKKATSGSQAARAGAEVVRLGGAVMSPVEAFNRRLLRARDAMDRAYAEPLDVVALARVASLSEAHFIRSFRAVFGETPHRYLQRRRVERSMFLLRETDRSVTDICFDVGFTSLGTFSRTFREIIGETPSEYRVGHEPLLPPNCFQMAAMRPVLTAGVSIRSSSSGEAAPAAEP